MAKLTIKIKAERLGTIRQVVRLLEDLESTYNNLYLFDFLVLSLSADRDRKFRTYSTIYKNEYYPKGFPNDPYLYELFWSAYRKSGFNNDSILEALNQMDVEKILLPSDRLVLKSVAIQSPGFWEVIGSLNPLQQIREYLKDQHERRKDSAFRNRQEEELGELAILEKENELLAQRIDMLRSLGYSEVEIRQLVISLIIEPLRRLGIHQEGGLIDGIED